MPRVYAERVALVCEWCGMPFTLPPSAVRRGKGRFCGIDCAAKAQGWGVRRTLICQQCKEPFSVIEARKDALFCGNACRGLSLRGPRELTYEQRFWSKVQFGDYDECWPWMAATNRKGYGLFGGGTAASRLAYRLTVGDPGNLYVLHTCDNPPCCNPLHLWLGTAMDNTQDMIAKGRIPTGDRHWTKRRPEHLPYMRSKIAR